jgi:hypothetical protein
MESTAIRPIVTPVLSQILQLLLPTPQQILLLRAMLLTDAQGCDAWRRWLAATGDPKQLFAQDSQGIKQLVPLLYAAVQRNHVPVDRDTLSYLRIAYAREKLRGEVYREVGRHTLSLLQAEGIPCIVLKGAAMAETVYRDWALRHCHDLDILVEGANLARATDALARAGFRISTTDQADKPYSSTAQHASGLPVTLHTRLFDHPYYRFPFAEAWARRQRTTILTMTAHMLAPADNLLHICGHASCSPSRATLRWLCDIGHIIARTPALDWDLLVHTARQGHLSLPLFLSLSCLQAELGAPIPPVILERLRPRVPPADLAAYEAVLYGLRMSHRDSMARALRRGADWRSSAVLLKWALFPSPAYVPQLRRVGHTWLLPFHYGLRLAKASQRP